MSISNIPIITIAQLSKIVELQFRERNFRPIFALGKGGIGKTESVMHLAKDVLKVGYIDIRLLLYNETDLKGIPYPDSTNTKTIWLQNNILPTVEKDGEEGILVFDEITSCSKSVRTAAYQLLNERRLGEYVLPDGWMIVCLGNGEEDGGDYQGMEGNFANRCSVYRVEPDTKDWLKWAANNGVNSLVTDYINFKPEDLHSYSENATTEILFASPRSWKAVSDIINKTGYVKTDTITYKRVIANVGTRAGEQFWEFCSKRNKMIDPRLILEGSLKPAFTHEDHEIVSMLINSLIKITSDMITKDLESYASVVQAPTVGAIANMVKWMLSLYSDEIKSYAIKDMLAYNEAFKRVILSTEFISVVPELQTFATQNRNIFA